MSGAADGHIWPCIQNMAAPLNLVCFDQAGIEFLLLAGDREEALQAALKHGLLGSFLDHLGAGQNMPLGFKYI